MTHTREHELEQRAVAGDALVREPARITDGIVGTGPITTREKRQVATDQLVFGGATIEDGEVVSIDPGGDDGFGTGRSVPGTGGSVQIEDDGETVREVRTGRTRETESFEPTVPDVDVNLNLPSGNVVPSPPDPTRALLALGAFVLLVVGVFGASQGVGRGVAT